MWQSDSLNHYVARVDTISKPKIVVLISLGVYFILLLHIKTKHYLFFHPSSHKFNPRETHHTSHVCCVPTIRQTNQEQSPKCYTERCFIYLRNSTTTSFGTFIFIYLALHTFVVFNIITWKQLQMVDVHNVFV